MLWFEAELGYPEKRRATHALVIGTSRYDHLPDADGNVPQPAGGDTFGLRQLKSAASSAYRFARWLRDSYDTGGRHPLATIRLLLSCSPEEAQVADIAAATGNAAGTRRTQVASALREWREDCARGRDGVAIFFAAGHGFHYGVKSETASVLLQDFAAARDVMCYSIDIGLVREGMRGSGVAQRQYYFIDACRADPGIEGLGTGLGLRPVPGPMTSCSPVFYATEPEQVAYGGGAGTGTVFCEGLLRCLRDGFAAADYKHATLGWHVSTATLPTALQREVGRIHRTQNVHEAGIRPREPEPMHRFGAAPRFDFSIELSPPDAAAHASADVWYEEAAQQLLNRVPFNGTPIVQKLGMGDYLLDVWPDSSARRIRSGFNVRPTNLHKTVEVRDERG